jgi:hypothetical protein
VELFIVRIRELWRRFLRLLQRKPVLSDSEQWDAWQRLLEEIHTELLFAFRNRYVFREIMGMFQKNDTLKADGGFVWEYLRLTYGHYQAMGVRREADRGSNVMNLSQLMYQMSHRPEVMSRKRYKAHFPADTVIPEQMQDEQFTNMCGSGDYMDPKIIKKDRRRLERDCKKVVDYANKMIAHRSTEKRELTLVEIHTAMDAIEAVHKKYYVLLTGGGLVTVTPAIQFNWEKVFMIPWAPKADQ